MPRRSRPGRRLAQARAARRRRRRHAPPERPPFPNEPSGLFRIAAGGIDEELAGAAALELGVFDFLARS
jgi:hypothetical protein